MSLVASLRGAFRVFLGVLILAGASRAGDASDAPRAPSRLVALGGDVVEIVYALGEQRRLVCDDETALYPPAARHLPRVGYLRTLSAEGVLACRPDLIIASEDAGPAAAMTELEASGIPIVHVTSAHTVQAAAEKITRVAHALRADAQGEVLVEEFQSSLAASKAKLTKLHDQPRALFVMTHGPGGATAAGRDTAADAMLTLAGADNVASAYSGYKPLTPEAALALRPDVIVIADTAVQALGGRAALGSRPEFALTPAAAHGRIVSMDALLLLGFGPRMPEALAALIAALHATTAP